MVSVAVLVSFGLTERAFAASDTALLLECDSEPIEVNQGSTCTVRVEDVEPNPTPPTGTVELATDGQGAFGDGPGCTLGASAGRRAFCQFTYTPGSVGTAVHRLTASYQGDPAHGASDGMADAGVLSGDVRFAAPGGTGRDPCGEPTLPCSLEVAADRSPLGSTSLNAGDEIVISPGTYSGAQDLGADLTIQLPAGVYVHGVAGQPRPVIAQDNPDAFGAVLVAANDRLAHIAVESNAHSGIVFAGGNALAEDLTVRSTAVEAIACNTTEVETLVLRDTVCLATGNGSSGVGAFVRTSRPSMLVRLRNVTAVSSGGVGIRYRVEGTGAVPSYTVDAVGVIARGAQRDVEAEGGVTPSTRSELELQMRNSSYSATATRAATLTPAGEGTNVEQPALLAFDQVHQRPGSPTIDAGAADGASGSTDPDGDARTLGLTADIGADEFQSNTTTSLACDSVVVPNGEAATCTATVTDRRASPAVPTGTVRFATEGVGEISPGEACGLGAGGESGQATCQVTYTTESVGPHKLTATYQGGAGLEGSQGSFMVTATDERPTETELACAPSPARAREVSICTATVTDTSGGPGKPSGSVTVTSDSAAHSFPNGATCALGGNGPSVSCSVAYKPEAGGEDTLTASYQDDVGRHQPSIGTLVLEVQPPFTATTTELACASPVETNTASTCTATVIGSAEGPAAPSGRISFTHTNQGAFTPPEASCDLLPVEGAQDRATCQIAYTPADSGEHLIKASYEGAGTHLPSAREATIAAVRPGGEAKAQSATELRCGPATVEVSRSSTCTATVTGLGPNPSTPAGEVEFTSDGPGAFTRLTCDLISALDNVASCQVDYTPSSATPALHSLEATYKGSGEHEGSKGVFALTVTAPINPPPARESTGAATGTSSSPAAPNTTLRKKPRKKTAKRKAAFEFVSDQPGSSFQCKLDKQPFKLCRSPFKAKVKPGSHDFQVRAINAQGTVDPTPAAFKWRVAGGPRLP